MWQRPWHDLIDRVVPPRFRYLTEHPQLSPVGMVVFLAGALVTVGAVILSPGWAFVAYFGTLVALLPFRRRAGLEIGTDGILIGERFVPHGDKADLSGLPIRYSPDDLARVRKLTAKRSSDRALAARLETIPLERPESYREAPLPTDALWAILEDGRARFEARLAAARLLQRTMGESARTRIEEVAEATARPEAREAFVLASLGDSP